jgi:hypothetical protein
MKYSRVKRNELVVFVRKLHTKPSLVGQKTRFKKLLGILIARIGCE